MLPDVRVNLLLGHGLVMLGGEHHGLQADGLSVLIVLHGHLALAVRPQVGERAVLADLGQLSGQPVGQSDGVGHQFRRLIGGISEHHALVSRADGLQLLVGHLGLPGLQGLVHAHGDVRGLLVQGHHHGAGITVKSHLGVIVPDFIHRLPDDGGNVQIGSGGDLTCHQYEAGAAGGLAGHAAHGVLLHAGIQDGIRHCVAELVGMSLCH